MTQIVAIIPARGGSLGIKEKNLQKVNGRSLTEIAISAAKKSSNVDQTYVSSDSEKILDIAKKLGAKTHLRSDVNSSATASMLDTLKEFNTFYKSEEARSNTWFLVLYPTYPFRTHKDLDEIIQCYKKNHNPYPDGLIGIKQIKEHPYLAVEYIKGKIVPAYNPDVNAFYRRQSYPPLWVVCHWACIVSSNSLGKVNSQLFSGKTFPYKLSHSPIDIDSADDLRSANFLASSNTESISGN